MEIHLTREEQEQLEHIADKHQYAELLWNITMPCGIDGVFTVGHDDAHEWKTVVDADLAQFPATTPELRTKLFQFYAKI